MPAKKSYSLGKSSEFHDLTLPSGATCQARRPGVQGLISAGLLDNFDELTALVKTEHIDANSPRGIASTPKVTAEDTEAATALLMKDKDKLATAFQMVDRLAAYVVTQPLVWVDYQLTGEADVAYAERVEQAAKDEAIPVRAVDLEDKMYLLQWAIGGTSDLSSFREGLKSPLAGMASI